MEKHEQILKRILEFSEVRNWKQFHNPKDISLSLVLEATEVLEHFQWKNRRELEEYLEVHKEDVAEELADVLYWVLYLSHNLGIDVFKALDKKMDKNEVKYPVEKAKGNHLKYSEL